MLPLVMNILEPLMTYSSPRRSAVVRIDAASEPELGSESPNEPSFSPRMAGTRYCCFCASVPNLKIGMQPSPTCARSAAAKPQLMRAISSIRRQRITMSPPLPPYSSG